MCLYSGPLVSENSATQSLENISSKDLDFLYSCLEIHPEHASIICKLVDLIHLAADVYLARATGKPQGLILGLVQRFLLKTATFNSTSPGGHILIWPFFIVGAECVAEEDRVFVTAQLRSLWEYTGFGSTLYAIEVLKTIWEDPSDSVWTKNLATQVRGFIM